jgi:hypothetical protein
MSKLRTIKLLTCKIDQGDICDSKRILCRRGFRLFRF